MLTAQEIAASARTVVADGYDLWLASNAAVLTQLDSQPAGIQVSPLDFLAAQPPDRSWTVADLMRTYNVLNATSFGEKGIPLQNWVMIDLGLLPSAFLLLTLPPRARRRSSRSRRAPARPRDLPR